jgi:hypothetical protein
MFNTWMDAGEAERSDGSALAALTRSARGWHGVQLAVLAFIGLCGVLSNSDADTPRWLQVTAGVLAISALALACASIFLVASVAWPFPAVPSGAASARVPGPATVARRLRLGVALTYVAVGVMALAASANWWPTPETKGLDGTGAASAKVVVTDRSGRTACGDLVAGPAGRVRLATTAGTVEVAISGVATISPVTTC